jgi:preprotein translocase subunit Sss1
MEYVTIYEFVPKSFQIYPLLISISIFAIGIIGYRSVRKHGFIRLALMPPNPFTQEYMNKIAKFFTFLFMLIGTIGLVIVLIQIPGQLEINKEFDKSSNSRTIELTVITLPIGISIFENIRLKEDLIINGQEFVFSKTENKKGYDWPQDLNKGQLSENRSFRISYINVDRQNIILKIEKKNY